MSRFLLSTIFALRGIKLAIKSEPNLKMHFLALLLVSVLGWYFQFTTSEWIACLFCSALVISFELMNTAIEGIADYVQPELSVAIGRIKDISAGAVLFSSLFAFTVGLIIVAPKCYSLFISTYN